MPKGVKLASGYVDRAHQRQDDAADDREQRLKALEVLLKKEEIDRETYDKLRFEIAGGSLDSTHLVKGLDFKLLERVRKGEDVYGSKKKEAAEGDVHGDDDKGDDEPDGDDGVEGDVADVDDAFDELEGREVQTLQKEKTDTKKGQLSTVSLVPGKKRSRDQILAELKAAREAAKAQKTSSLGSRFKKIGSTQKPGTRIERDSKGREVMIIVDEDGHEKRKVRKLRPQEEEENDILTPNPDAKPLGMDVPEQYRQRQQQELEQDEDLDIFDGVGDDYDPLAGMDASDSDSDDEKAKAEKDHQEAPKALRTGATDAELMPPPPRPVAAGAPRNYFKDAKSGLLSMKETKAPSLSDPDIMAAIKRAAALHPVESEEDDKAKEEARAMEERRKKLLQMSDRDDQDLDMGFGTSRFEDEEDFDESKVKLSKWRGADGGDDDDGGEGRDKGGQGKRKRGPKKRKGDVNKAEDVLRVMEQRKKS